MFLDSHDLHGQLIIYQQKSVLWHFVKPVLDDPLLFERPIIIIISCFFHQATYVEAPLCLLKLEFLLPEEKFVTSVEEAEKTLQQEKQQLQRKQNVKETLQKHKVCLKTYYFMGR